MLNLKYNQNRIHAENLMVVVVVAIVYELSQGLKKLKIGRYKKKKKDQEADLRFYMID